MLFSLRAPEDAPSKRGRDMKTFGNRLRAATLLAALLAATPASTQTFSNAGFEINRERVKLGTINSCAKSAAYLVPTLYLYTSARKSLSAGGGLGRAKSKARVFIEGLSKTELQDIARRIHAEIVARLRAAGFNVLTFDDVRSDVADKARMSANPRYGMPTHDSRAWPGMDFTVATPSDEQALDYGLMGPQSNFAKAAQRTGATLLLPEIYLTLPQLGATASHTETQTWRSSEANISFDPAMHFAGATVYGATAKGGWCSIGVPEHGVRVPAAIAGQFKELSVTGDQAGEWSVKRGDFTFIVDQAAFRTGALAAGRSLAQLIADTMDGKH
jgi:hypothetical protein